jgi:hypothetical protein
MNTGHKNNKKLSKVLSTKLSIDDYNAFLILTKLKYEAELIKEESTSELLRFTICHILNPLDNNLIYPILEEEQGQQQNTQNNQQQLVNPVILPSTTEVHHQKAKLYQTSDLDSNSVNNYRL